MEGRVRWYSAQGFGFIDVLGSPDGKALYFHVCDVKGRSILKPGDAVTFDVVPAPKGPKCVNARVAVLETKEAIKCPQTA
jgi:cold shock CspA family protein